MMLALVFLTAYAGLKKKRYRIKLLKLDKREDIYKLVKRFIAPESSVYKFYSSRVLKYSRTSVEELIVLKLAIFIAVLIMACLIKLTNISMQTSEIFERFDFHTDLFYSCTEVMDERLALKQEIGYLEQALKTIKKSELYQKPEEVQMRIRGLITIPEAELQLPRDTLVNKVYNRLKGYYEARKLNLALYILVAALISFVPEGYFLIRNVFEKADARKELRFLKKLIILNGSIKPVDFREILRILINNSRHYRQILQDIEDKNKRSFVDNRDIYMPYIKGMKELEVKLFFEKLDEANNYDFDQAIKNIDNEFRLEKREDIRRIRKRIEFIHTIGVMGFMVIILVLVLYLVEPWLKMYDMNQLGI